MPISELVGSSLKQWTRVSEIVGSDLKDWQRAWELQSDGSFKEIYSTGGLWFIDDAANIARAYSADGQRNSGADASLGNGSWRTGAASPRGLYFMKVSRGVSSNMAEFFTAAGVRQATNNISLTELVYKGGFAIGDRLYFVGSGFVSGLQTAMAYTLAGGRSSSNDIRLPTRALYDTDADATRIYMLILFSGDYFIDLTNLSGTLQSAERIQLTNRKTYSGVCVVDDGLYAVNDTDNRAEFYNLPARTRNSRRDINLGTGTWRGAVSLG